VHNIKLEHTNHSKAFKYGELHKLSKS